MTLPFVVGFLSALISSMSGAGAALFATPLFLACGYPLPAVLASNQISAAAWTPIASRNYLRRLNPDWRVILGVASLGLVGVSVGFYIVVNLPAKALQPLIGVLILAIVALVYAKDSLIDGSKCCRTHRSVPIACGFPLGIYQAVFGSGNTMFSSLIFCRTCALEITSALGYSYAVAFPWCFASALLFLKKGWVSWQLAAPAAAGSIAGAHLGSKIGNRMGSKFVKRLFLVFGGVLGLRLLIL